MRYGLAGRLTGALALVLLMGSASTSSPVADAAMRGDAETVQSLVAQGEDVDTPQGDGMTALHWAAVNGSADIARVLLEAGADHSAVTRNGDYAPLHLAARRGSADVVELLLKAGADVQRRTSTGGVTALHMAAGSGDPATLQALLGAGANADVVEEAWGQTALMFAASAGHVPALRTLLEAGADPSVTSRVVSLPAQQAVDRAANQRRDEVLARFHEEAGSPVSWRPTPEQVQEAVKAAQEVQRSMAAVAAEPAEEREQVAGEEVVGFSGLVGTQGGLTALLHAVREGYSEASHLLLEGGADINQPSAGDGTSPILMATINGHFDLALELLDEGADPNLANDAGALPLFAAINTHWAPRSRYPQQLAFMNQQATYMEVMRRLLEAGADPNAQLSKHLWFMSYTFDLLSVDTRGATAFWRAAYATDVEAMKLLVEFGADPNIPTTKGAERRRRGPAGPDPSGLEPIPTGGPAVWPIHAASGVGYGEGFAGNAHRHVPEGWVPAVRYLVEELGADVNARDHNGYSPVHHAAARGDNELILYLVEKGADVTGVSRRGQTTVDMANGPVQRISPFPETIALLESLGAKNNNRCLSC